MSGSGFDSGREGLASFKDERETSNVPSVVEWVVKPWVRVVLTIMLRVIKPFLHRMWREPDCHPDALERADISMLNTSIIVNDVNNHEVCYL